MTPFECKVRPRRRRLEALLIPAGVFTIDAFILRNEAERSHFGPLGYPYFFIMSCAFLFVFARLWADHASTSTSKTLRIDDEGIAIDGVRRLRKKHILGGAHLRPRKTGELTVRIPSTLPFRSLEVDVANAEEGLAVLRALGQDPAHAAVRFRLNSGFENPLLRKIATVCLAMAGVFTSVANARGPIFLTLGSIWLAAFVFSGLSFLLPTHVTIGTDGVFVAKGGRKRFLPFSKITEIQDHPEHADAIVLVTEDGEKVSLRTNVRDQANKEMAVSDDTRALRARLDAAMKAFRERAVHADALLQLKRSGRSAKEWIEALENLRKERGYREMRVSDEELWRVLEDPAASAEDRAAALVALRASLDDEGKARQRVALEACVEPRLRVVYDAAVKEDEAELEAALENLHETA